MPQTPAYHSIKLNTPNVYHDNSLCTEGNNIEKYYFQWGTGNRRRCEHCTRLALAGR